MENRNGHQATRRTVIVAGAANVVVGVAKLVARIMSGSSGATRKSSTRGIQPDITVKVALSRTAPR